MMASIGNKTNNIHRVSIGPLTLGDLQEGEWRYLTKEEENLLLERRIGAIFPGSEAYYNRLLHEQYEKLQANEHQRFLEFDEDFKQNIAHGLKFRITNPYYSPPPREEEIDPEEVVKQTTKEVEDEMQEEDREMNEEEAEDEELAKKLPQQFEDYWKSNVSQRHNK